MKRNWIYKSAIIAALLLFGIGCATTALNTSDKKYLAARTELNLLIEQYLIVQDQIPMETHIKAKELFTSADALLDGWEVMLGEDYDFGNDLMTWIKIKNAIIEILMEVNDG